jgi:hypothetical protein
MMSPSTGRLATWVPKNKSREGGSPTVNDKKYKKKGNPHSMNRDAVASARKATLDDFGGRSDALGG